MSLRSGRTTSARSVCVGFVALRVVQLGTEWVPGERQTVVVSAVAAGVAAVSAAVRQ